MGLSASGKVANVFHSAALLSYLIGKGRGSSMNNVNPFYISKDVWLKLGQCMHGYMYMYIQIVINVA